MATCAWTVLVSWDSFAFFLKRLENNYFTPALLNQILNPPLNGGLLFQVAAILASVLPGKQDVKVVFD